MSVADAKAALDACQNGIALMTAQQKSNQVLVNDYNRRHLAWEARRNTANQVRNQNKINRQNAKDDWDNRRQNNKNEAANDRENAGCGLCGSNPRCRADWAWVGSHRCAWLGSQCENECRRTSENVEAEADRRTGGSEPHVYDDPPFSEGEPAPSQQNTTPINISCCANVLNVVGSDVNQTQINQQNDCLSSKTQALADAKAKVITDKAVSDAKVVSDAKAVSDDANKRKIVMIIAIICLLMSVGIVLIITV